MRSFGNLVINEWLKLSKKRSFFIPYAVLIAFIALFGYLATAFESSGGFVSTVEFVQSVMSKSGMGQFIVFLGIICTAGIVTKEYSLGTIKLLLIRSQSRNRILASKYVTAVLYTVSLFLCSAIVAFITGGIAFGFNGSSEMGWNDVFMTVLYTLVYTLVYVTITFMVGVLTKSTGATIGIGMFLVLLEGLVTMLLSKYAIVKYLIFTNADLSVYSQGGAPFKGMTLNFSLIVVAVYMVLFLGTSFVTFKKRDVA
ncbi:ABC transporter permease [Paenibacillus segetis]|uniref:ABC transporter permease n=1 Tax=Paenibacillus segetis TaxID=1325360 RepID=A0ABQ1Y1S9_9BACL|nr:DUF2705 family protein [Paenibacillus segetis]GGH09942.1 hypothetical protein GCM10008013_01150 [Paenibacillus segetis]